MTHIHKRRFYQKKSRWHMIGPPTGTCPVIEDGVGAEICSEDVLAGPKVI